MGLEVTNTRASVVEVSDGELDDLIDILVFYVQEVGHNVSMRPVTEVPQSLKTAQKILDGLRSK